MTDALRVLYDELTRRLPSADGNPCGSCLACCTGHGLSHQNVMGIEFEALQERYGEPSTERFRAYAERRRDESGALLHERCPFYDEAASGCGIYPDRPFSCRVFGHFRMHKTRLPDACVFEASVREIGPGEYFRDVPMARELRDLQRAWDARRPPVHARANDAAALLEQVRANIDPSDPADLAVIAQLEGRRDDALALLDQALATRPDDAYVHLCRGNILDELKRTAEAQAAYERALDIDPAQPRAWSHLGFTRVEQGDALGARDAFAHAVELQGDDATARGFLGWLTMATARSMDEIRAAAAHLEVAVMREPTNAMFHLRRAEALLLLGQSREALPHLQAAADNPRLVPAAEAVRARFAALLADA